VQINDWRNDPLPLFEWFLPWLLKYGWNFPSGSSEKSSSNLWSYISQLQLDSKLGKVHPYFNNQSKNHSTSGNGSFLQSFICTNELAFQSCQAIM
jgi:hypothetical protein